MIHPILLSQSIVEIFPQMASHAKKLTFIGTQGPLTHLTKEA